jgi:hypothetical protein
VLPGARLSRLRRAWPLLLHGGYGCNASTPVPQRSAINPAVGPGEEAILVLQRGPAFDPDEDYDGDGDTNNDADDACFPGDKAANAVAAGWDAVPLVNRHHASGSQADDEAFCGSGGFPPGAAIVTVCTTHQAFHLMFNDTPEFGVPYDDDVEGPAIGTVGEKVEGTSVFDGWGYAHLYRNNAGKLTHVDAYAIPEALDPRYSTGFGDSRSMSSPPTRRTGSRTRRTTRAACVSSASVATG